MARPNPINEVQDIQQMLVGYTKQETVEPLKTLGRYLGLGLAGAFLMFLGTFFVGLATLRLLQSVSVFEGSSWASLGPYGLAIAVLAAAVALLYLAMSRAKKKVLS